MTSHNNGIHDNLANNNGTGVAPRRHTAASESRHSVSLTSTNIQSKMEALAEDFNSAPLPPMAVTTYVICLLLLSKNHKKILCLNQKNLVIKVVAYYLQYACNDADEYVAQC